MWVLETILNVKVSSETCMHNFISAHRLACTSLSVDKDLDQTTVGCAGKLVPRVLGKKPRRIHMAHCHSSTPEALIEKHTNDGELLGLTYHSDPLQTMMCGHCLKNRESKLVASASGAPSSQGLSPTQAAPCAASQRGAAVLDQAERFCSPAVHLGPCYFQLSIGFFFYIYF